MVVNVNYDKTMKILVTGGAGFIGSNFTKHMLVNNHDVTVVDDLSNGYVEFLPTDSKLKFIKADFSSKKILSLVEKKQFDVVVHLAAVPRVSYSVEHPIETNDTNVSKTLLLMNSCVGNIKRFVFASSSSVYGGADVLPTREAHHKDPKSPYALQKSIIEQYLKVYKNLYGLESACMRFFNVFGPYALGDSPYATALAAWLTAIKKGVPMRSDGDGSQSRDLCYVDNVVDALAKASTFAGIIRAEPLNVATGSSVTNKEILEYLLKRYTQASFVNAPERAGDVKHTKGNIEKISTLLNYKPSVSIWDGIKKTCDWYDENWDFVKNLKLSV